jgi:hypothetical protein
VESRAQPDNVEFYSGKKLGAVGSDLAAIAWFFDRPYAAPAATLTPPERAWVLNVASMGLRSQGRLKEALRAMRAGLQMEEKAPDWRNAAVSASNLSQAELLVGQVAAAAATAEQSVALADRAANSFQMLANRATQAAALHAAGEWEKAASLLADAERRHRAAPSGSRR